MPKIFVNGISAKSGGGRSILTNFLKVAREVDDAFSFVVAVPSLEGYASLQNERISFVPMGRLSQTSMIPLASLFRLPSFAKRLGCAIVFNLSDIPIATRLPQVFLFDWSYAAFPDSPAWRLSTFGDKFVRRAKLFFFKHLLPFVDVMVAQNEVLASQLRYHYQLSDIAIIPNAVSIENLSGDCIHNFDLGGGFKFLCLSRYYSHKNLEILLPLAERMKAECMDTRIITTVSPDDGPGAVAFLSEIKARNLGDMIVNLGTVPMQQVPSLYQQTDALILPTWLESFSGTYVEAMYHRKPIFTSRLPFATGVCGSAAYYFDPGDEMSVFNTVKTALSDPDGIALTTEAAAQLLNDLPSWEAAYRAFTEVFKTRV